MESTHDSRIAYWDHEPGIPGGETPPSTAGETPAATDDRFMESTHDSRIARWDHELGNPGGETPPSTAGGTPAATDARFMGNPLEPVETITMRSKTTSRRR